jgi:hypothetical protein
VLAGGPALRQCAHGVKQQRRIVNIEQLRRIPRIAQGEHETIARTLEPVERGAQLAIELGGPCGQRRGAAL